MLTRAPTLCVGAFSDGVEAVGKMRVEIPPENSISKFPMKEEITMYPNMSMPPPWAWGYPPQAPHSSAPDLSTIREWARMLKDWEKEIKGDEKKKPEGKGPSPSVISVMLLMLLLSPITGPSMYYFFQLSLGILHK